MFDLHVLIYNVALCQPCQGIICNQNYIVPILAKGVRCCKEMIETNQTYSTEEVFAKDESNTIRMFLSKQA